MSVYSSATEPAILSLREVAAWDLKALRRSNSPPRINASVPALQRGLVWSPQQVELLWDSILRGFPIGSFVVSAPVLNQEREGREGLSHHLLDGQQRSNAIALGFYDPFNSSMDSLRGNTADAILWLDIAPEGILTAPAELEASGAQIPHNSTRRFLTRVTTKSHPWGYKANDDASCISAGEARGVVKWAGIEPDSCGRRPSPAELLPVKANAPVPMAWLLNAALSNPEFQQFWLCVRHALQCRANDLPWPKLALERLKSMGEQSDDLALRRIHHAIQVALTTRVVVLQAPTDLVEASRQEEGREAGESVANIEHLFHRLNRQGKVLEGEELAYSLIKAYWPAVADVVDEVQPRRIPASHLVSLAVRVALTHENAPKLHGPVGISRLRSLANAPDVFGGDRSRIEQFLNCEPSASGVNRLANACALVDSWLVYDVDENPHGLPPVLVSGFARQSADYFTLFLLIADRMGTLGKEAAKDWRKRLPGIATLLHWFTRDGMSSTIANTLYESFTRKCDLESLVEGLRLSQKGLLIPLTPQQLGEAIPLTNDDSLIAWNWWPMVVESGPSELRDFRVNHVGSFVERIRGRTEILLYAQRAYLAQRFSDYDPSRRDLWDRHNRPWDFDHLHANKYLAHGQGAYADVCRRWGQGCIGNLRAWPFEDNRSDSKEPLKEKLKNSAQWMAWSLIESEEIEAFSRENAPRYDQTQAYELCNSIKSRFLRIYEDWYLNAYLPIFGDSPPLALSSICSS